MCPEELVGQHPVPVPSLAVPMLSMLSTLDERQLDIRGHHWDADSGISSKPRSSTNTPQASPRSPGRRSDTATDTCVAGTSARLEAKQSLGEEEEEWSSAESHKRQARKNSDTVGQHSSKVCDELSKAATSGSMEIEVDADDFYNNDNPFAALEGNDEIGPDAEEGSIKDS
jgi:hypothetical protein